MDEEDIDGRLLKADRYSKLIALFFAGGVLLISISLVENMTFNMTTAGLSGIGIRLAIPYFASVWLIEGDSDLPRQFEASGDYNHGAVGLGLIVGSFAAIGVMLVEPNYSLAMAGALVAAAGSYVLLRVVLE